MLTPHLQEHLKVLLRKHVLFSLLDPESTRRLIESVDVVGFTIGETIIQQGDRGDCAYLIHSGRVRVLRITEDGRQVSLATLGPGELFGEYAVLRNETRNASVRASEDVVLFRINQADFLAILKDNPALDASLHRLIRTRSVMDFLRVKTILQAVPVQRLLDVAERLQEARFEEGETILAQGERPQRFYLIRSGEVRVTQRLADAAAARVVGTLTAGQSLGEDAIARGVPASASFVALVETTCLCLDTAVFEQLLADVPALRNEVLRRLGETASDPGLLIPPAPGEKPAEQPSPLQRLRQPSRWERYPWVPQHDETDCGAASLAMVARRFGIRLSVGRLRETAGIGREGVSMLGLAQAAEAVGFNARAVRADFERLTHLELPAIAHWKGYHYVVVWEASNRRVVIGDPAVGLIKMTRAEFEAGWTGRLLLLMPTPRLEQQIPETGTLHRFLPFLMPHRRVLVEVLLAALLLETLRLSTPIFTQLIVDKVLVHHNTDLLLLTVLGMAFIGLFQIAATIFRQYLLLNVGQRLGLSMTSDCLRQAVRLPMHFYRTRTIGDFLTRFQDVRQVKEMLTGRLVTSVLDVLVLVTTLGLMLFYSFKLTLVAIAAFPLYAGLTAAFTPAIRRLQRQAYEEKSRAESTLVETLKNIGTVKEACAELNVRWKYEEQVARQSNSEYQARRVNLLLDTLFRGVNIIANVALVWFGAHLVLRREMTVGQLMAFNALVAMAAVPILGLVQLWFDLQNFWLSLERIRDVYDAPAEQETQRGALPLPRLQGHVRLENVSFRYAPDDRNILRNINLDIKPGQCVALVGRSGAGKTTLALLLQRLYLPTEGKITIDGFDLSAVDVKSLRDQIGVVSQDATLFTATIRENIALARPEATLEEIITAARQANAHDFIMDFPMAYDTIIGELGVRLSGGQRQRLAIARALLKDPRLLILDEATAALDYESEQAIQQNLQEIMLGRTTLVIAHRLSTVRNADFIVVLDAGQVVEIGTHADLTAKRGLYYYLTSQQVGE